MASTDVYKLALPTAVKYFAVGVMAMLSLFGIGMIVWAVRGMLEGPPLPFLVLWCAALAWNWYVFLGLPHEIRFESADRVSFVALARTATLRVTDIDSIKPYWAGGGLYVLRHTGGTIRLLAQFTGFHEVISRIKAANPRFETVGI